MKSLTIGLILLSILAVQTNRAEAVIVYFTDGSQLEVERATRVGETICLFVDPAKIDLTRTQLTGIPVATSRQAERLAVVDADFAPSDDNLDIIATGKVVNHSGAPVRQVRVLLILMDQQDQVLLRIHGYVQPDTLANEGTGSYRVRVQKPAGFAKARVEIEAEIVPVTP